MVVFVSSWKIDWIRHKITLFIHVQWIPEKGLLDFFFLSFFWRKCLSSSFAWYLFTVGFRLRITLKAAEQVKSSNTRCSHSCRSMITVRTKVTEHRAIFLNIFRIIKVKRSTFENSTAQKRGIWVFANLILFFLSQFNDIQYTVGIQYSICLCLLLK